ncbi:anthranilate phosphoribosyltransferase [Marinilabiliaceae bacterium JC017]|nr:anthranilate phosphoribosyltransferase [Marinilabiliaceae bacterium JC017]
MLQQTLKHLFDHKTLSKQEARTILINIARDAYNKSEVVAFLSVYMMRTVTVDELSGFRDALLELCLPVDLSDFNTIDLCGTGGDGKNTFNISTLASLVVAGTGAKVAKHGNYGVSSSCGSSNMMEYLGYQFTNKADELKQQLDQSGICFLHAPLFHPAMRAVGPIRKELGIKTFFNMLGPMVNPSSPQNQLMGVFDLELARIYNYIYQQTGKNYTIIHALDGYDEISLTGDFKVITNQGEKLLSPFNLGMEQINAEQIQGGASIPEAAKIFTTILDGQGTEAQNNVVIANAAMALQCYSPKKTVEEAIAEARESLLSGKAKNVLTKLLNLK